MKNEPVNATADTTTKTHYEMVSGFNSAINGAKIVENREKKLLIANVEET